MRTFLSAAFLGLGLLSQVAFAADVHVFSGESDSKALAVTPDSTPIYDIMDGVYTSSRPYFTNFEIQHWANELLATGLVTYGNMNFDFEVVLDSYERNANSNAAENQFSGRGYISVIYGGVQECRYPIEITILAYEEGLFVKSRNPQTIPAQAPVGACFPPGANATYRHPAPYVWSDDKN